MPERAVLYRDDTGAPLGVVAPGYRIHQPAELFEAWRDELAASGLRISSAGVLKGGRVPFVCVAFGPDYRMTLPDGDTLDPYVTLATSFDGSMATRAWASTVRTVCRNTLEAGLANRSRHASQGHRGALDVQALKAAIGMLPDAMRAERAMVEALQAAPVERNFAREILATIAGLPAPAVALAREGRVVLPEDASGKARGTFERLMLALNEAPGAMLEGARGTAWGIVNAVTYFADHAANVRDTAKDGATLARVHSAQFGSGAEMKRDALKLAAQAGGLDLSAFALAA